MASLGNLFFKIGADVTEATKGIKQVKTELESIKKITGFSAIIQGANAAIGVLKGFVAAVTPLINEFDKAAKSAEKLRVALKNNTQGVTELKDQANKLAGVRLFSSDQTVNAQALLANLGLTAEAIRRLTPLIQDFATAQGLDLATATQLVGRAVATGSDSLKKYGISIGDAKNGSERFAIVMAGLKKQFEGQAEAAAKVGAGPLQLMVQRFSQIKEISGEALVRFVTVFIPEMNKGIDEFALTISSLPDKFERMAKSIKTNFSQAIVVVNLLQKSAKVLDDLVLGKEAPKRASGRSSAGIGDPVGDKIRKQAATEKQLQQDLNKLLKESGEINKKELLKIKDAFSGLTLTVERTNKELAKSLFIQDKENEILRENTALIIGINSEIDKRANQLARDLKRSLIDEKILTFAATEELKKYIEAQKGAASSLFEAAAARARALKTLQDAQGGPTPVRGLEPQAQDEEEALFLPGTFDKTKNLFKGLFASVKDEDINRLNNIFATQGVQAYNDELTKVNEKITSTNDIIGGLGTAATQAFSGLAASLLDGSLAFKDLGLAALDAARKIVNAALAEAIAAAIAGSLANAGNVIAGLALAAVAVGVVTALFKSKIPKLAKGGLAYGPQIAVIGDNPNASRDPEVVSPLSKLHELIKGEMYQLTANMANAMDLALRTASVNVPDVNPNAIEPNGPQEIVVRGEIENNVIRLAYDRSASTHAKFQPGYY